VLAAYSFGALETMNLNLDNGCRRDQRHDIIASDYPSYLW